MTQPEHKARHQALHAAFDELLADFIVQHPNDVGVTTKPIFELMTWSAKQTEKPDHEEKKIIP